MLAKISIIALILVLAYFSQVETVEGFIGSPLNPTFGSNAKSAEPRMTFQYPMRPPWHFYQSPWMMYQQPWLLSKENYYRYSVPSYFSKITR